MTLSLAIFMPISVRWLARKWHLGIHFHNVIMMIYMIDILRRHTHPHSWVFNAPVFVLYAFDKVRHMHPVHVAYVLSKVSMPHVFYPIVHFVSVSFNRTKAHNASDYC